MPPTPRKPPPSTSSRNRNFVIAGVVALAVVAALVVGSLVLTGGDDSSDSSGGSVAADTAFLNGIPQDAAVLGTENANVTLIQFEDLQCPVCKAYTVEGFPGIVDQYVRPGKVKVRFVGLSFIGPDSEKALRYVIAAGRQGKLWQMNDALYRQQGEENSGWVTDDLLESTAQDLGLDWDKLKTDASSAYVTQTISSMAAEGQQKEVPGTPTFYIQIGDAAPYNVQPTGLDTAAFQPILDDALNG